jgi:hypothetical protein
VAVLEQADTPLATWDIEREARVSLGRRVRFNYAGDDGRLCWAGRRVWGLYRHGLLPGVRTVSKAAAIYIHAAGQIETKPLYFVMRRVGYTISPNTLTSVLSYEPWVIRDGWQNFPRSSRRVRDQMAAELALGHRLTLNDVLDRAWDQLETQLAAYRARLTG